jgi:hypothetical protein
MRKLLIVLCFLCMGGVAFAGQNTLTWTDNSNNEDKFNIERKAVTCTSSALPFSALTSVGKDVITYVDTAVVEGTTYCYRVNAENTAGKSVFSNTAERTVPFSVPNAPSGLGVN